MAKQYSTRAALLLAVRDQLRESAPNGYGWNHAQCRIMLDGKPPANAPTVFAAIHGAPRANRQGERGTYIDDWLSVYVTISRRTGSIPFDELGEDVIVRELDGIDEVVDRVRGILFVRRFEIYTKANNYLGSDRQPFLMPGVPVTDDAPQPVGADWFSAQAGSGVCGVKSTINISGWQRVQSSDCHEGGHHGE